MQTVLGANGQIAEELARELHRSFTVFDSSKFAARFPDFAVTTYRDGIRQILQA